MKIAVLCPICSHRDNEELYFVRMDIREDGLYKITCPKGHNSFCMLQNQKFELLFDSGSLAFNDGYYREAVASWAAALERFFEFHVRVIAKGIGVDSKELETTWKFLSNNSESQFGAFLFAFLSDKKKSFEDIITINKMQEWHKFRNRVVHRGKFPEPEEALKWGEFVYNLIYNLIRILRERFAEAIQETISIYLADIYLKTGGPRHDIETGTYWTPSAMMVTTMICVNLTDVPKPFKQALEDLKNHSCISR